MSSSAIKYPKRLFSQSGGDPSLPTRVTNLENNEYKITYYEIISGASGSITIPAGATINAGEFGLSGNCILSKIDGSNKPTFESPKTAGGVIVTASLNTSTGAWVTSGTYTDSSVALIYSIKIKAINYSNLTYANIIETADDAYDYAKIQSVLGNTKPIITSSSGKLQTSDWVNIVSSCTFVGWSSYATQEVDVLDMGTYYLLHVLVNGTSNSATTTIQLPYTSLSTNNGCGLFTNNGTSIFGRWVFLNGGTTITFTTTATGTAWTASGTKGVGIDIFFKK